MWRAALSLVLLCALVACHARPGRVRAWEQPVVIPTYSLLADDVNPRFAALEGPAIYPYPMQDSLGSRRVPRTYRAIFLENDYLRVMCLPELGGRIQSVLDKRRNAEVFYRNHVVKPGLIALRGAWTSGGIEWNRGPESHSVTTFSPVDVRAVEHPDGSASLVIGTTEKIFRTTWDVRLTLEPGRSYLAEAIALANPTDGFHSYYFWNNTAFPATSAARFIFPMTLGSDHNGETFFTWPSHDGRDLTWVRNYPEATSIFAYQAEHDFFGAYDAERDYGIAQTADHRAVRGKKAWTWGQSEDGLVSQAALTDEDGPYIEVQSGPLPTQADFGVLGPGQTVRWQEWWLPLVGLGDGFEFATRDLVIARHDVANGVEFRLLATGRFPAARVEVRRAGSVIRDDTLPLLPDQVARVTVGGDPADELDVRVASGGVTLAEWHSPLRPLQRTPPSRASTGEPDSPQAWLTRAARRDRGLDARGAREDYERAVALDPGLTAARLGLGVLDLEQGHFESALAHAAGVLDHDAGNAEGWYLKGAALAASGRTDEAFEAARHGVRAGAGGPALILSGRLAMRQRRARDAIAAFEAAVEADRDSARARELLMLAEWFAGDRWRARSAALREIGTGTVHLIPHYVLALGSAERLRGFARLGRRFIGEPEFLFLELANTLLDLGLDAEAEELVEATLVSPFVPGERRPLPLYYLAWLASRRGDDFNARRYREQAAARLSDYVFPSRVEELPVLEYAVAANPADGRARLYLGHLLAGLGRLDEAAARWREAVAVNPGLSVAWRSLAMVAWRQGDPAAAETDLRHAIGARPTDPTLYRDLGRVLFEAGQPAAAVAALEQSLDTGIRRGDVLILLARGYLDLGRFDAAIALLEGSTFSNWEGNTAVWRAFAAAHLARGQQRLAQGDAAGALADFDRARTYPANLGVGRPARPREARVQWQRWRALRALGRITDAGDALRACAAGDAGDAQERETIAACRTTLARAGGL